MYSSMRISRFFAAFAAMALLLTGAGCFGGSSAKATTGGVWLSADSGQTWTAKNVLPTATEMASIGGADVLSFAVDPQDSSALYIGTQGSGLLYSVDDGASWMRPEEAEVRKGAVLDIAVSNKDICTYYVLKADRLMKTTTCGRAFDTETYVEGRTNEALTALALDWYNPNVLYLGTTAGEVLKSSDAGGSWTTVYRAKDAVVTIEVNAGDSRYVIMGGARTGIHRSEDMGITWVSLEDSMDDLKDSDRVYGLAQTADGSTMIASSKYGLVQSTDKGLTWTGLTLLTARGDVVIRTIAIDPTDANIMMYGTDTAVYRSDDGGLAWSTYELPSTRSASVLHIMENDGVWLGVRAIED